MFILSYNHSNG